MRVNLLPANFVWKRTVRKCLLQWFSAICVACLLFFGLSAPLLWKWCTDSRDLARLRIEMEPIELMQSERIQLEKSSVALIRKINHLRKSVSMDRSAALLGIISQSVQNTDKTVQVQEMLFVTNNKVIENATPKGSSSSQGNKGSDPKLAEPAQQHQLTLKAIALDADTTFRFMQYLQTNLFPKVELRSTQERLISDHHVQEFQLECLRDE